MPPKILSAERVVDSSDDESRDLKSPESHKRKSHFQPQKISKRQKLTPPREKINGQNTRDKEDVEDNEDSSSEGSSSGRSESRSDGDGTGEVASTSISAVNSDLANSTRTSTSQSPIASSATPAPWQPPAGFESVPEISRDVPRLARLFASDDSLTGKQIWHVTAPASVPIDSLSGLVLDHINSGEVALSHGGTKYTLVTEVNQPDRSSFLLIPNDECVSYRAAKTRFTETIHLQQAEGSCAHPSLVHDPVAIESAQPRPQPQGLRTRFWPAGFEENSYEVIGGRSKSPDNDSVTTSSVDDSESSSESSSSEEEDESLTGAASLADKSLNPRGSKKTGRDSDQESHSSSDESESDDSSSSSASSNVDSESSSSE